MLLAYLDEIGETGAFVSRDDRRYNTSPAFGYAGFVIDANKARSFGHIFFEEKRALYQAELAAADHPSRWERKGSDIFRTNTHERLPHQIRVVNGLVQQCLKRLITVEGVGLVAGAGASRPPTTLEGSGPVYEMGRPLLTRGAGLPPRGWAVEDAARW